MKYVIIGNSAAAVGCIEGIRSLDKTGDITVISNEPYHTYSRPLISYWIYGKSTEQSMKYRKDSFYEDNKVTTMLGETAVDIDSSAKEVKLQSGKSVAYDKLLVATGSKPFVPPINGYDTVKNAVTFMSFDDAKKLMSMIAPDKKVMVLGAGLIGLKCVEAIAGKVASITVVDLADRVMPSVLDKGASDMIQTHIEQEGGVQFLLSDSVDTFAENKATLKSGTVLDFDILVMAVGVRPNTELVKDAGGQVNRGIVTDFYCATNLPDVYSAGDCSESFDITTNCNRILALLPNAYMQGNCAGINMAGGEASYDKAIPMNAIGFFGLHVITAGVYEGEEHKINSYSSYKRLFTKDGLLKGYILVGDVIAAGIYTSLIREKTPLDTIDFELVKIKPQLMAFSKSYRDEKLGGVGK